MVSIRQIALTLTLLSAALPLCAESPSAPKAAAPNLANIRAQFAAKDATIADLQRQVAEQAARIAELQKQTAAAPAAPASVPAIMADKAIQLSVTAPATPMAALLASLSRQAGVPILIDDTVEGTLGATAIHQPSLELALDQLKTAVPGLAWQKVALPQEAPLPKGNALSRQVRDLQALTAATLTVMDPATQSAVALSQKKLDSAASVPAGMRIVYLVTNETVRTRRQAEQKAAEMAQKATEAAPNPAAAAQPMPQMPPANAGQGTVAQAVSGLQGASDMLGRMTPDEQRQALPMMLQQFGQMMQKIDPTVRREVAQQMMQQWQQFHP